MAENNLEEILKPFYQRASEAETRLARLEGAIAGERNSGNGELLKKVGELESKPRDLKTEQAAEREKVQKELQHLMEENAKLQYRITHLVRALKDADCQLQSNDFGLGIVYLREIVTPRWRPLIMITRIRFKSVKDII